MSQVDVALHRDIEEFERVVRKLSKGVNQKDIPWNDGQAQKLRQSISEVAKSSNSVMVAGKNCETALDKFYRIASEV